MVLNLPANTTSEQAFKLTDVSFCPLVFRARDARPCLCGFPPGLQGAVADEFHSHLHLQVVEPVTGESGAGLSPQGGRSMGWQEESRARPQCHTVPIREIQLQEKVVNTNFLQMSSGILRASNMHAFCNAREFEGFQSQFLGTLEVGVQGVEVG